MKSNIVIKDEITRLAHYTPLRASMICRYIAAAICGFQERERRTISMQVSQRHSLMEKLKNIDIWMRGCGFWFQVGMQNSSLGVVLATSHFSSAMVALPPAISAVIMNIMGSTLGFCWKYIQPSDEVKTSVVA